MTFDRIKYLQQITSLLVHHLDEKDLRLYRYQKTNFRIEGTINIDEGIK